MAIQNFLSGGFYGSIGEMTGRRWKNKRVLQEKFKPANPRTPAQEKQRRLFTQGSALAKIAQQVNWHAPQFTNPIKTDWNQRQTVAINALKDGATDWEALPLAPKDFKAQHIIGGAILQSVSEDGEMKILLQGTNLLEAKKYACALFIQSGNKKGQIIVGSTPMPSVDALTAVFRLPDGNDIIGEDVYIKIASIDDTETDTVTLSAGIYLKQDTEMPYVFQPSVTSIELDSSYVLRVAVKLGQEAIESYDAFTNISIRIFDKVWTKATAVNANKLDTDNWQDINEQLTLIRTTVAKTTATVTFACQFSNAYLFEKYAAKLDITFDANNVKGATTKENSQNISLSSVEMPEYLQTNYFQSGEIAIRGFANENVKVGSDWMILGKAYMKNDESDTNEIIAFNEDWNGETVDGDEIESVTFQNGKTATGDELEEILNDYDPAIYVDSPKIGWYFQTDYQIKSFEGTVNGLLICESEKPRIAMKGYRVFQISNDSDEEIPVIITN